MKILVTGGAGFIGSHLCERLLADGAGVICLDNLYTGSRRSVARLKGRRFKFVKADVTRLPAMKVDRIFHLACPASPVHYQAEPIKTTLTSVVGTHRCLKLAAKNKARILFTSTSEVYGDPEVHPQREDYRGCVNPMGVRSCYDEGKRCAESLCGDFERRGLAEVRVARIFNTYGPRMAPDDGRVVSNFIIQALAGRPLTVYGDGSQTRSFCFVSDMVEGLVRLMDSPEFDGPVNLGNPAEFAVMELAEMVLRLTGSRSKIVRKPLPQDDPCRRRPDISKARRLLGWEPKVSLEEGLRETIEYFSSLG
ncbi:MAG: SDR family oxidoreductase [Deltaproteobacteria bacterium]|nr:SDR family oxidoreductase [Deltaproteobacteria bacterium]